MNAIASSESWIRIYIGGGGFLLELQHGLAAISRPFGGCRTAAQVFARFQEIDSTLLLGVYLWVGILVLSALSLGSGIYGLARGKRGVSQDVAVIPASKDDVPSGRG